MREARALTKIATPGLLLACVVALGSCASDESQTDHQDITSVVEPLYLNATKWPTSGGTASIQVCFDRNITNEDPDFATNSVRVRVAVLTTWTKYAKIDFNGWGSCPTNRNGMIGVRLVNAAIANGEKKYGGFAQPIGYPGATATSTVTMYLGPNNGAIDATIVHEFGHALGFQHEMRRSDFSDEPSPSSCNESNLTGGSFLDTPPDINSIMAAGYCSALGASGTLSFWDVWGVQQTYGVRYGGIRQLATAWNNSRTDYATVSTADRATLTSNSYKFLYSEGWLLDKQAPQTVPLQLYWNASRNDYFTTATTVGVNDAIAFGYTFVRTIGYVYPTRPPDFVIARELKLYWNAASQDNLTTANPTAQQAALAAGYTFIRTEGYILHPDNEPFVQTWWLRNASIGDNVSVRLMPSSGFGMESLTHGWSLMGADSAVFSYPLPGTSEARIYRKLATSESVMLANEQDKASFSAAGYDDKLPGGTSYIDLVGYLFNSQYDPSPTSGVTPFYLHSKGNDNFTTSNRTGWAGSQGYVMGNLQGFGLAVDTVATAFSHGSPIYDNSTTCTVGGLTMHCCPNGYAMVGVNLGANLYKCAQPSGGLTGSRTLAPFVGIPPNISVFCQSPSVMVGFDPANNRAACQQSTTLATANGTTGSTTYNDRCTYDASGPSMHICPHVVGSSITYSGFMAGYNQTDSTLSCVNPANRLPAYLTGPGCDASAVQSTTLEGDVGAENAIDGNTDPDLTHGSVTHTGNSGDEFWYVGLGSAHTITGVNIYNRMDCCSERLTNFTLQHLDQATFQNVIDLSYTASTLGVPKISFTYPSPVTTGYVLIQKTDFNYLSLAEVQVLGF